MDQSNQTQPDERELYLRHALRLARWHRRNVEERMAKDAVTLELLVRALQEPRGVAKGHAESFRDYIRSIVKAEIAGVQKCFAELTIG